MARKGKRNDTSEESNRRNAKALIIGPQLAVKKGSSLNYSFKRKKKKEEGVFPGGGKRERQTEKARGKPDASD